MSTELENAVKVLEGDCALQGTNAQPYAGSAGFYVIWAHALGLCFLRQCAKDGISDEAAFNERYKLALRELHVEEK